MKIAISVPDEVFAEAERLARRMKKSRSQLYAHALREYVARHADDRITEALNEVVDKTQGIQDRFARSAARKSLMRVDW
jgi:metal-responsive CopG/Arc/MetJ family transcriptional regulator